MCHTHRVDCVNQLARFAELHETFSQVVERTLHQNLLLLVVVEQVVPQRLLGQSLRIAHNDHTISAHIHKFVYMIRALFIHSFLDLCFLTQSLLLLPGSG